MTMLATFIAHINDWNALLNLHAEFLLRQARDLGAVRYQVLRNARNAAEVLIVVELSTYEDAQEMAHLLGMQRQPFLSKQTATVGLWEDMGWEEITACRCPNDA